jgi:hypothetical protein
VNLSSSEEHPAKEQSGEFRHGNISKGHRNPPRFLINVESSITDLVLAVSVATSGTARHFVGLLMDMSGVGCGRRD